MKSSRSGFGFPLRAEAVGVLLVTSVLLWACSTKRRAQAPGSNKASPTNSAYLEDPASAGIRKLGFGPVLRISLIKPNKRAQVAIERVTLSPVEPAHEAWRDSLGEGPKECVLVVRKRSGAVLRRWPLSFKTILFWDNFNPTNPGGSKDVDLESQEVRVLCQGDLDLVIELQTPSGRIIQTLNLLEFLPGEGLPGLRQEGVEKMVRKDNGALWGTFRNSAALRRFDEVTEPELRSLSKEFEPMFKLFSPNTAAILSDPDWQKQIILTCLGAWGDRIWSPVVLYDRNLSEVDQRRSAHQGRTADSRPTNDAVGGAGP
jgi:hypothetical protein